MRCIEQLIDEIYKNSKIPFQLKIEDNDDIYSTADFTADGVHIEKSFDFYYTTCWIKIDPAFSVVIDLLIFSLKSRLEEIFLKKQNIIQRLINNKEVDSELVNILWPQVGKNFYFVVIYLQSNLEEVYSILKEGYLNSEIEVFMYKESILMLGNMEDYSEHIGSIFDTISNNYSVKCYIIYEQINNIYDIGTCYKELKYKLDLAQKYNCNQSIIDEKQLILEGIIDSIPTEKKKSLISLFNNGFSMLDKEMVKTIEVFFKCGLNISEASKELYIHRNTLIYRLDKIEKLVAYDIRDFRNAVVFNIMFFIWKEKNK